jgi:hypothetical protein
MTKKKTTCLDGFNELYKIHHMADNTHLHVFDGMSAEEIVRVCRACLASEWDVYPHDLTPEQLAEAKMLDVVPRWDRGAPQPSPRYALRYDLVACVHVEPSPEAEES